MSRHQRFCHLLIRLGVTATLLVGLGSALLATPIAWASPGAQMGSGMAQLQALSGADFEIAFMSMMLPHHATAVAMAKMALKRAGHAELKAAAQQIISSQQDEITKMTQWLQQWYQTAPQQKWGQMMQQDMQGMGMDADMQKLANLQGDAFDQQFLMSMNMHHAMAVQMAQMVPQRAVHSELKTMAQSIIASQSAEMQQFTQWLKAWYNREMPSTSMGGQMPGGTMGSQPPGVPATGGGATAPSWLLSLGLAATALLAGLFLRRTHHLIR